MPSCVVKISTNKGVLIPDTGTELELIGPYFSFNNLTFLYTIQVLSIVGSLTHVLRQPFIIISPYFRSSTIMFS